MATTTTAPTIRITDMSEIVLIDVNKPYKEGQRFKDKKTFNSYRYEGTVFTVQSDSEFCEHFKNRQVKHCKLLVGSRIVTTQDKETGEDINTEVKTLQFDSFKTRAEYLADQDDRMLDAKVDSTIARYAYLATAPVTAEMLTELQNSI